MMASPQTLPKTHHLDPKSMKLSRIAGAVAVILMGLAVFTSNISLSAERNEKERMQGEIFALREDLLHVKGKLQSVEKHCAMEINGLQAQISRLKEK